MKRQPNYWAVVPAAGIGRRMGSDIPKQYLGIAGMRVIEHTLARLCGYPRISEVVVAIAAEDRWWDSVKVAAETPPRRVEGGEERCHSVLNGLAALSEVAADQDWVLVHDAVRPCVRREDIERLIDALDGHPVGGLLGVPVRDTMKRVDGEGTVVETVTRERLWHALTPQMFRLGPLREAIEVALAAGHLVTDEAQAMERTGAMPLIVEGHADNIKVTQPEDLPLAEHFLRLQGELAAPGGGDAAP